MFVLPVIESVILRNLCCLVMIKDIKKVYLSQLTRVAYQFNSL